MFILYNDYSAVSCALNIDKKASERLTDKQALALN